MIQNEKGSILLLTLTLSLIIATLLLTLSQQLQSQTHLFTQRRDYLTLTLLEKECLTLILQEIANPNHEIPKYESSKEISLSEGEKATLKYSNYTQSLDVTYQVYYNEYLGKAKISYDKKTKTYTLTSG